MIPRSGKEGATYDKNVVFPTSASPKSNILTSGGPAIPIHLSQLERKYKPLMTSKRKSLSLITW
jgi:hypothetical protein